jgi:hypothetical protein
LRGHIRGFFFYIYFSLFILLLNSTFYIKVIIMLKGLAITPPIVGRISIGRVVEKNNKRLPEKDDQFTITTQVQNRDGWVLHPVDEVLRENHSDKKLRAIPVRLLFNDPDLNLRAEYTMFDRKNGRPICTGNGERSRRRTQSGMETLDCPTPDRCEFGKGGLCKPYARLTVQVTDDDALGTFMFRTTGFNSIRSLAARLNYFKAVSGDLLACLPLELRLRGKSTAQSHRTPIYYVDLVVRSGMSLEEAITTAQSLHALREASGFQQKALDDAARIGFEQAEFEISEEEATDVIEEFYPETENQGSNLKDELNTKVVLAQV